MKCSYCAGTGDHYDTDLGDWAPHGVKCKHCQGWGECQCQCPQCDIYGINRQRETSTGALPTVADLGAPSE